MNGFRVLATNHTSFTVSDLDRSIAFFSEVLGFEMVNRALRDPKLISSITGVPGADIEVAYIQGPGHRLELIQYHGPSERSQVDSRPCDSGFAHVAYDVDDVDAAVAASAPYQVLLKHKPDHKFLMDNLVFHRKGDIEHSCLQIYTGSPDTLALYDPAKPTLLLIPFPLELTNTVP